jgi:hypothetical protein
LAMWGVIWFLLLLCFEMFDEFGRLGLELFTFVKVYV